MELISTLTDTGGDGHSPGLAVLAGRRLLAFQAVAGGAEELAAGVEVGAVRTLVPPVVWHVQFGTADLCKRRLMLDFTAINLILCS